MKWFIEITKTFVRKGQAEMMGDMLAQWAGVAGKFRTDKTAPRTWTTTVLVPESAIEDGTVKTLFGDVYGTRLVAVQMSS